MADQPHTTIGDGAGQDAEVRGQLDPEEDLGRRMRHGRGAEEHERLRRARIRDQEIARVRVEHVDVCDDAQDIGEAIDGEAHSRHQQWEGVSRSFAEGSGPEKTHKGDGSEMHEERGVEGSRTAR